MSGGESDVVKLPYPSLPLDHDPRPSDIIWRNPRKVTRLSDGVNATTTILKLTGPIDLTWLNSSPYLLIGREVVEVLAVFRDWQVNVARGARQTNAVEHPQGQEVDWYHGEYDGT